VTTAARPAPFAPNGPAPGPRSAASRRAEAGQPTDIERPGGEEGTGSAEGVLAGGATITIEVGTAVLLAMVLWLMVLHYAGGRAAMVLAGGGGQGARWRRRVSTRGEVARGEYLGVLGPPHAEQAGLSAAHSGRQTRDLRVSVRFAGGSVSEVPARLVGPRDDLARLLGMSAEQLPSAHPLVTATRDLDQALIELQAEIAERRRRREDTELVDQISVASLETDMAVVLIAEARDAAERVHGVLAEGAAYGVYGMVDGGVVAGRALGVEGTLPEVSITPEALAGLLDSPQGDLDDRGGRRAVSLAAEPEASAGPDREPLREHTEPPKQPLASSPSCCAAPSTKSVDTRPLIAVMGPLEISCGDRVYAQGMRTVAHELAGYLAARGPVVSSRAIATALWPYATGREDKVPHQFYDAVNDLRAALRAVSEETARGKKDVRKYLGRPRGREWGIIPADALTDVGLFRQALDEALTAREDARRLAALERAAALYRDDFCPGVEAAWAQEERVRLRGEVIRALGAAADLCEGVEPERALKALNRALAIAGPTADICSRMMKILARLGRVGEARDVFARHNESLSLRGECLSEEIRDTYEKITNSRVHNPDPG
jgi:DNA-binding SARP family transcriptional activator